MNHRSKLTVDQVQLIRGLHRRHEQSRLPRGTRGGPRCGDQLAKQFGVSPSTISHIVNRLRYAEVP